jgi:ketosteroid isomerase-like protein
MSQENVEIVRRGYEHWLATGDLLAENFHPDFVWDMSTFDGWLERQTYSGIAGGAAFIADWDAAWEDWTLEVEDYIDAGDELVVAIIHQRARSKGTGVSVDMHFGQVWTIQDGKQRLMRMYGSPAEALAAAGMS